MKPKTQSTFTRILVLCLLLAPSRLPAQSIHLVGHLQGRHPRLLFTPEEVPVLKARAQGPAAAFFTELESYVSVSKPPDHRDFLTNATDAQRQGLWRLPTVALHYVLTGNRTSFENARGFLERFLNLDHWETGVEEDSGMAAANLMVGAALAYDWLYNDLSPDFREAFRAKLRLQATRMYALGHQQQLPGSHYWQQDPQNNHRWHRNAGLALAVLATTGDTPDDDPLLQNLYDELQFIARWLPEDGASHEGSSYMVFGGSHLLLAFDAADRCLGTRFIDHPFFKETVTFRLHTLTPGLKDVFCFGDCAGVGSYNNYLFRCIAQHNLKDYQAAVMAYRGQHPKGFWLGWFSLLWYNPDLAGGTVTNLPLNHLFPDQGLAIMRDGWQEHNAALMFKCSPYGGLKLNQFRNQNDFAYINVAHDDPDANSFLIYANGRVLAKPDGYAYNKHTAGHNTILVNGRGQKGEGHKWTQPLKNTDMTALASITAWVKGQDGIFVDEGEAGGAYDDLQIYRRSVLWAPGHYILLLDHIQAPDPARITWLLQSREVDVQNAASGRYRLREEDAALDVQIASAQPFQNQVVDATADHRGSTLGYRQLQLTAQTATWTLASLYNAWNKQPLSVRLHPNRNTITVTVTGPDFTDIWTWVPPAGQTEPSTLLGRRGDRLLLQIGTPLPVETGAADFDGDDRVTFTDFIHFARAFGTKTDHPAYDPRCDLNPDGQIDFPDFLLFAQAFGNTTHQNAT